MESRVRQLVMKLELVDSLQLVHPFVKGFEQQHYVIGEAELNAVSAGEISEAVAKRTAQDIEGVEGGKLIYSTTFYIGLRVEPKPGAHFKKQAQPGSHNPAQPVPLDRAD